MSQTIHYVRVDIAEMRTVAGERLLIVGIDRTSKVVFVQLHEKTDTKTVKSFLQALIAAVAHHRHTILTDNGTQFADLPENREGATAKLRAHPFKATRIQHGIEHRLTKPNHPLQGLLALSLSAIGSRASWPLMDQRPSRTHESNDRRCDGQPLSLRPTPPTMK